MTTKRIRREYGSIRAAIQHCISLNLSVIGADRQLETSPHWVKTWEGRLGLTIRRGARGENQSEHAYHPTWENFRQLNAQRHQAKLERMQA